MRRSDIYPKRYEEIQDAERVRREQWKIENTDGLVRRDKIITRMVIGVAGALAVAAMIWTISDNENEASEYRERLEECTEELSEQSDLDFGIDPETNRILVAPEIKEFLDACQSAGGDIDRAENILQVMPGAISSNQ